MKNFIPYEKMSKRQRQEIDRHKRRRWGAISPVTRRPENPKAYDRKKTRKRSDDSLVNASFLLQV